MQENKIIELTYDTWWQARLLIAYTEETLPWMKQQVLFWSGGKVALATVDGDAEKAYLQMLARQLIVLSMDYNQKGVSDWFDTAEGWASLDEKFGVLLLEIDTWAFDECDFDFKELTPGQIARQDEAD